MFGEIIMFSLLFFIMMFPFYSFVWLLKMFIYIIFIPFTIVAGMIFGGKR